MIYAFTGLMGSGKTTACEHLLTKHVGRFKKINFKDALVLEMREKLPDVMREIIYLIERMEYDPSEPWTVDRLFRDKPPIFRALMQNYATEIRRADDPAYWIIRWKAAVTNALNDGRSVVVDDCRFLNEAAAIKDMAGVIIRIERADIQDTGSHTSETEMLQITPDHTISVSKGEHERLYEALDVITLKYEAI